jgi:hypothetical protein
LRRSSPRSGQRIAGWVLLALAVLALAWLDGGERDLRTIEEDIPMPEGAS